MDCMKDIELALSPRSYALMQREHGNDSNVVAVAIKNLVYLQRDYDAVKNVKRMRLSPYILGREHLMKEKKEKLDVLWDYIKSDGLITKYFRRTLNKSQNTALREALRNPLSLIHGPPGTGKTKYALMPILKCAHLAMQRKYDQMNRKAVDGLDDRDLKHLNLKQIHKIWRRGRIGIFCGSNQAIDEIIASLMEHNKSKRLYSDLPIARMGNSQNMDPLIANNEEININLRIESLLDLKWDKDRKREIYDFQKRMKQKLIETKKEWNRMETALLKTMKTMKAKKRMNHKLWENLKSAVKASRPLLVEMECLGKVQRARYPNQAQRELLPLLMGECECLFSTANYLGRSMATEQRLKGAQFDIGLLDECCQMRETETLIAMQHCSRAVLVGDPKQLEATILYHGKYRKMLLNSMFDRIEKYVDPIMLNQQYRMNKEIAVFPSKHFYGNKLKDAESIHRDKEKLFHQDESGCFRPFLFFDVVGAEKKRANSSLINLVEIQFIEQLLLRFMKNQKYLEEVESVGIITPYSAHKQLIHSKLQKTRIHWKQQHRVDIECVTVDEFQGSERDIIIFSCVRSNTADNIGFLSDDKRLNVAITRAKYALWIIGNAKCLQSADATWNALIENAKQRQLFLDGNSLLSLN